MSTPCVTAAGAASAALAMFVFGVLTPKLPLNPMIGAPEVGLVAPVLVATEVIAGAAPRNRYGGL